MKVGQQVSGKPVIVEGVTVRYGSVLALDQVSLEVPAGSIVVVLGPSGCGKTTLLRLIAGLVMPDAGRVWINGRDYTDIPPYERPIGMVFQDYALFPHLSVWNNIAFGLRMRRLNRDEIRQRVERMLKLLGLRGLENRYPKELSGGQQQRVALARALVVEPSVLLLDEPFAALDRNLREELRLEFRRLHERLTVTTLFVTHDQEEALVLGDRVAVMRAGRVVQVGEGRELYYKPKTRFVAEFFGNCNVVEGVVVEEGGRGIVVGPGGVKAHLGDRLAPAADGRTVQLTVRPECIRVSPARGTRERRSERPAADAELVVLEGVVEEALFCGGGIRYRVKCTGGLVLTAMVWGEGENRDAPKVGEPVVVEWKQEDLWVLDREEG
jgi:spermidine/putrescine ABC transporter ATP-binding subunit